jgi:hypothetical protein
VFITFRDIWMSKPETFQDTAMVKLGASAQVLGQAGGLFATGSALTSRLSGNAQQAQGSQASGLITQGATLATGVTQTANMINQSGQVMKAAKARLTSLVTMAKGMGFWVDLNSGVVTPAAWMCRPPDAAAWAAKAVDFNSNIQTVVFQVNAHDIAVKLGLAKTALDVVNFVMGVAQGSGSQSTVPTTPIPGATPLPTSTFPGGTMPTYTTPSPLTPSSPGVTAGSGVGAGAIPSYGLAGAGQLGASPMGGAGAAGLGAGGLGAGGLGAGGIGSPGSGTSTAGVSGMGGANQPSSVMGTMVGQSGGSGGSMVGMGGAGMGGAGRDSERRESSAWRQLTEDEDLWDGGDIPDTNDGVLA